MEQWLNPIPFAAGTETHAQTLIHSRDAIASKNKIVLCLQQHSPLVNEVVIL